MNHVVHIVNAFVDEGVGGNPAGVVLAADTLDTREKLALAKAVGLSETAFVSRSEVADIKLEFFTPTRQIPHCGHATIATFSFLQQQGLIEHARSSKETIDGRREIVMRGQSAYMEQTAPTYSEADSFPTGISVPRILESIGVTDDQLVRPPLVCATGNRFLLIHMKTAATLSCLTPNMDEIGVIGEALGVVGYYVFATDVAGFAATTRMFAPHYGIPEEAATGMAAGPLGCYLYDYANFNLTTLLVQQGAYMQPPSPSRIDVQLELKAARIERLFVGGDARLSRSLTVIV